jgi:hypothetical protein
MIGDPRKTAQTRERALPKDGSTGFGSGDPKDDLSGPVH